MATDYVIFGLTFWQVFLSALVLSLPIIYLKSSVFKYHLRLSFFYVTALVAGVFVILYALPRPRNWRNHLIPHQSLNKTFFISEMEWGYINGLIWMPRFVKLTCKYLLSPLFGMEVVTRGLDQFKLDSPGIVVVNHQSSIDMIPIFSYWPKSTVCLAKKELWYTGTFGLGAWLCGTVYIDRGNSAKARKTMDNTLSRIKQEKLKVLVFPEGTRNHTGSMLPFKKGAFHLAVQAQVPIIPMVISSYEEFYNKSEKRFDEGKVVMEVLPPIPTEGLTGDDVTDLTEKTRSEMLKCFERISAEAKIHTVS